MALHLINTTALSNGLKFAAYLRVSTNDQGRNGYGMGDQEITIQYTVQAMQGEIVAWFREVQSGGDNSRPELANAIAYCQQHGTRLVVAKLDRLARNVRFVLAVIDDELKHIPLFCDMPNVTNDHHGRSMLIDRANRAEWERGEIKARTKRTMAIAKLRGVHCGRPAAPDAARMRAKALHADGHSLGAIGRLLAREGFVAPSGNAYFHSSVKQMLAA
jgi:DNA invertase Pin-like site-specific DNA recombinase